MRWGLLLVTLGALAFGSSAVADEKAQAAETGATAVKALSVADACCALKDLKPGPHKITFIHPDTCCPVTVCFCLPCGCYEVKCSCDTIRFKYPGLCNDVVIKFRKCGDVRVKD
jgi:hypothetical protein